MIHPELFQGAGICTLIISTSPRLSDIVFSINRVNMTTGTDGTIRKFVKQGSCTVKLLNLSLTIGHNIPEVAFDRVREFVRGAGYKGDIKIPIGPYDQSKYCHIQQSLSLVKMLGDVAEIGQIEIVNDGIHVVSRNGESRTIVTGILNWDSDLQKTARSHRRSHV